MSMGIGMKVVAVAIGGAHTCAIVRGIDNGTNAGGGSVKCWGENFNSQLGVSRTKYNYDVFATRSKAPADVPAVDWLGAHSRSDHSWGLPHVCAA